MLWVENITNIQSFIERDNYKKMYKIAVHLGLYILSNRITLIDDDYDINYGFPD